MVPIRMFVIFGVILEVNLHLQLGSPAVQSDWSPPKRIRSSQLWSHIPATSLAPAGDALMEGGREKHHDHHHHHHRHLNSGGCESLQKSGGIQRGHSDSLEQVSTDQVLDVAWLHLAAKYVPLLKKQPESNLLVGRIPRTPSMSSLNGHLIVVPWGFP